MPEEALLEIKAVDVFHGTFQVLWDVYLTVHSGEIVALIGANTAGKSSLLDTISGFLKPRRGNIRFRGEELCGMPPFKIVNRGVIQVPEGRRIFPDLNVLDNLIIGSYSRRARALRQKNLEAVYGHFPVLRARRNQPARTLSGGEQQMLAIGRGLMANPITMLLDEMSLGLAPVVISELYKTLHEIRQRGISILFVEQNVRRSLSEADRAYILETGRLVLSGPVTKLREEEKIRKAYFGI